MKILEEKRVDWEQQKADLRIIYDKKGYKIKLKTIQTG